MISKSLLVISAFGLVFSCIFRFLIPNYRDKINENNQIISKSEEQYRPVEYIIYRGQEGFAADFVFDVECDNVLQYSFMQSFIDCFNFFIYLSIFVNYANF